MIVNGYDAVAMHYALTTDIRRANEGVAAAFEGVSPAEA
jgi:hypothetical protein